MIKAFQFSLLDFRTVRPYFTWKNLAIFVFISALNALNLGFSSIPFVLCLFLIVFSSYTFATSENAKMDSLYLLLGFDRKEVVTGRYLGVFFAGLVVNLIAFVVCIVLVKLLDVPGDWKEIGLTCIMTYYVSTLTLSMQFSVLFSMGYQRGKLLSMAPMYVLFGCGVLLFAFFRENPVVIDFTADLLSRPLWLGIVLFVVWLTVLFTTYRISVRNYEKRDLLI